MSRVPRALTDLQWVEQKWDGKWEGKWDGKWDSKWDGKVSVATVCSPRAGLPRRAESGANCYPAIPRTCLLQWSKQDCPVQYKSWHSNKCYEKPVCEYKVRPWTGTAAANLSPPCHPP